MVFKITVARPPFSVAFETGSVSEAIGVFQSEETEFAKLFELKFGAPEGQDDGAPKTPGEAPTEPVARRGRGPNKPKVDAVAPAPIAIPGADAPPTVPSAGDDIPEALRRDPAIAAPPPPPAPPAPPAAPPSGVLAGKIAAELERRAALAPGNDRSLADWLVACGICVKGATFKEATDVLRLQGDEKLGPIAAQLGVA